MNESIHGMQQIEEDLPGQYEIQGLADLGGKNSAASPSSIPKEGIIRQKSQPVENILPKFGGSGIIADKRKTT